MQLIEILHLLKGVKGNGNQFTSLCPAHSDKAPSLSISQKDNRILLHCHAGCSTEAIVMAMGLNLRDLFYKDDNGVHHIPNLTATKKREIVAVYDYKESV
jgi:putative DNA primase/helicase